LRAITLRDNIIFAKSREGNVMNIEKSREENVMNIEKSRKENVIYLWSSTENE